ncbi:hypothetical protein ACWZQY_019350 [Priestia megaterium]
MRCEVEKNAELSYSHAFYVRFVSMNLFQPTKGDFIAVGAISILAGAVIGFITNIGCAVLKTVKSKME